MELVPAADPNIPAQVHRMMKATALYTVANGNPLYDQYALNKKLLTVLGIDDIDDILPPPQPPPPDGPPPPDPMMMAVQAQSAAEQAKAQMKLQEAMAKLSLEERKLVANAMQKMQELKSKERIAELNDETKRILGALEHGADMARVASENYRSTEQAFGPPTFGGAPIPPQGAPNG